MPSNSLENQRPNSHRQRLALLIHALQGGGAERVLSQLANRWCGEHQVHVVTWAKVSEGEYPLLPQVHRHALDLQLASSGILGGCIANVQRVKRLRACLREVRPDRILSFCDQMNIVALEAARGLPHLPVWIAEHSDPQHQQLSPLWEAWRRRSYRRATVAVALTQQIADYMRRWISADRLRVIPTAIADRAVTSSYQAVGNPLNTLLFVGRLSQEKNLSLLLSAWRLVQDRLPDWQLVLVGDGDQRQALQRSAADLNRVQFVGWQSCPEPFLQRAQLFVLSSSYEGFPVALLESLSYGVPAVTTACSSALDELQAQSDSEIIRIVRSHRAEDFARALLDWANDPASRQAASAEAIRVAASYSWKNVGPKWDDFLK